MKMKDIVKRRLSRCVKCKHNVFMKKRQKTRAVTFHVMKEARHRSEVKKRP
jgi:DNA-directed RNA polymerase subunit RPC12/RpoP